MNHSLVELLQKYTPQDYPESDPWEQECKKRMLVFIEQHANCFERSLEVGHFTGSAWLLNRDQTKALMTHHTKLDMWIQLGGHCDGDPDILNVAQKEAQEESGIQHIVPVTKDIFDIDIHLVPTIGKQKEHYHYDIRFLLQVTSTESVTQNHESKELRWISKNRDELPTKSRSVIRMFDKWIMNRP